VTPSWPPSPSPERCLRALLSHLRGDEVAVTGGLAIQQGLAGLGGERARRPIADLDLVASSVDAVAPSVAEDFLVSHYHVMGPSVPKFMVQLVHPELRIRVDVFPDLVGSRTRATTVSLGSQWIKMLSLEDVLEHKLLTLAKASPMRPVDPKHVRDARALGRLLHRTVPHVAESAIAVELHGSDPDAVCARCARSRSDAFPLAPKGRILDVLGYL